MHGEDPEHAVSPSEGLVLMDSAQVCPPGPSLAVLDAIRTPAALIPRRVLLAPSSAELHVQILLATC